MEENIDEIEKEMRKLKEKKKMIKQKIISEKIEKKKEKRMRSDGNNGTNKLIRVSNNFSDKLDIINEKREENGLDRISNPKATELIIKHKSAWNLIERDLVFFDTHIEEERMLYAQ